MFARSRVSRRFPLLPFPGLLLLLTGMAGASQGPPGGFFPAVLSHGVLAGAVTAGSVFETLASVAIVFGGGYLLLFHPGFQRWFLGFAGLEERLTAAVTAAGGRALSAEEFAAELELPGKRAPFTEFHTNHGGVGIVGDFLWLRDTYFVIHIPTFANYRIEFGAITLVNMKPAGAVFQNIDIFRIESGEHVVQFGFFPDGNEGLLEAIGRYRRDRGLPW